MVVVLNILVKSKFSPALFMPSVFDLFCREVSIVLERVLKRRRAMVAGNSLLTVRSNGG